MAKTLTGSAVDKVKPGSVRREIPDKLVPGLYLVVQPSGRKSWAVRYRFGKRTRKFTLKGFHNLAKARELARTALVNVSQGRDPALESSQRGQLGKQLGGGGVQGLHPTLCPA